MTILNTVLSIWLELFDLLPIICLAIGFIAPNFLLLGILIPTAWLYKLVLIGPSQKHKLKELWECIICLGSLSLLFRFISGGPSTVELRKHDKLAKASIFYRIFRHII
jgi:hypothetical protein